MSIRRSPRGRRAYTLVELLVVIAIMLALAALAAAFMPRVQDSTQLNSAVDQLEQWLLTAKMRAKRDGLMTGVRLLDPNATGMYTQCQYIQQPDPLSGGTPLGNGNYNGGYCASASGTTVNFPAPNVDFTGGQSIPGDYLVLPGDYLELRDSGGIHTITAVSANALTLSGAQTCTVAAPTANYRILRQPRPLVGENPLQLPGNLAVDPSLSSGAGLPGSTATVPFFDVLFAPSGSVVGANAGSGKIFLYVHDLTQNPVDPTRAAVVAVQTLTGYIGAYNAGPAATPYLYANEGRGSGL